ncbi:hypothetical protein [Streptomyces sp. BK205]|uniref:hypothetical protein n=1 Tax=Streptomyces sp. BK205 TaxID=2512164 RepID=UPI0010D392A4|nr:hypothetical protein [Streptomyces sp. BK205]TCR22938.1 hypothetical protein EV578_104268 [Streptomyces sp. BK205]
MAAHATPADDALATPPSPHGCARPSAASPPTGADKPEQTHALGRKQTNLLTAVLRGLPLLDDTREPVFMTHNEALTALRVLPPSTCAIEAGEANRLRPRLLSAVIGPGARRTGYLHGLPRQGVEPLLQAVHQAVRAPLVLRIVYGASTRIPLRALSYVLPAVEMAVRLRAAGSHTPYLQVICAGSLGSQINALDDRDIDRETAVLTSALDRLLSATAPGRYGIYRTLPGITDSLGLLHRLVAGLTDDQRAQVIERLNGKGGASAEQTLLYAAAHVALHDHAALPLALEAGHPRPPHPVIVDIGGLQERHFFHTRRLFAPPQAPGPGALVLTRHSVPPYTMARGGDVSLRDYLCTGRPLELPSTLAVAPAARHDLRLLHNLLPMTPLLSAPQGVLA